MTHYVGDWYIGPNNTPYTLEAFEKNFVLLNTSGYYHVVDADTFAHKYSHRSIRTERDNL